MSTPARRAESILATTLRHPAPVPLARHLEVPDLDRDAAPRGRSGSPRRARRRSRRPPSACGWRTRRRSFDGLGRERHQLLGPGVRRGRILERRSRPRPRPRASRPGRAPACCPAPAARRPIAVAQHHPAHLGRAHVARQVDADALRLQPGEVLAQRAPVRREPVVLVVGRSAAMIESLSGPAELPSPRDLGGDALEDLRRHARVDQDGELGLPQHVDEARAPPPSPPASTVWRAAAPSSRPIAAIRPSANADVRRVPGRAGAVDDVAVANDDVVGVGPGRAGRGHAGEQEHQDAEAQRVASGEVVPASQEHHHEAPDAEATDRCTATHECSSSGSVSLR